MLEHTTTYTTVASSSDSPVRARRNRSYLRLAQVLLLSEVLRVYQYGARVLAKCTFVKWYAKAHVD